MNILVVDDDQDTVVLLTMLLKRQGWTVDTASTLSEAKNALSEQEYGVLVTDLHLPDGDGIALAQAGKFGLAILVTGGEDLGHRQATVRLGWQCLAKPVTGSEIVGMIRRYAVPEAAPA
jgi:two-component system response regulator PilR (NtrC family)